MPVEKLSISMPDTLAARIDEFAERDGVSRSNLIQEAAARYVASRDAEERETRRVDRVGSALRGFDAVAAQWGADDRLGTEYLDEVRGEMPSVQPADDQS